MNNIGKRIKELRRKNDLTQERLADYLCVTDKAVSKWECGLTMPDLSLIVPLSRILKVSTDELLIGKREEIDMRRAEFDKHCSKWEEYVNQDNYNMALQAASEYPGDYKYLTWLAHCEYNMAYNSEFKEDQSAKYSDAMMNRAIEHYNIVIEECNDEKIREKAIWNAMVCCRSMEKYDEALKYADMFPQSLPITRFRALEMCLQGEKLKEQRKEEVHYDLRNLIISLSRIYYFAEKDELYVQAAIDTAEGILKAVFPDENYYEFYGYLCCAYQKRAEFAVQAGDYEKAVMFLKTMMDHARKVPCGQKQYTSGVLSGLDINLPQAQLLPYFHTTLDDVSLPMAKLLENRVKKHPVFEPLWHREDFYDLFK